jgi:Haem-binding domain
MPNPENIGHRKVSNGRTRVCHSGPVRSGRIGIDAIRSGGPPERSNRRDRHHRDPDTNAREGRRNFAPCLPGLSHGTDRLTVWPWYSNVAPMLWLMAADVNTGREHMNLSRWGRYRPGEQVARLNNICAMVRRHKMPLWYYRPLHPSAALSGDDVAQLCAWTDSLSAQLTGSAGGQ